MVEKEDVLDPVRRGEVGYIFSGAEENTMVWVLRGKVLAGAIDNQAYTRDARAEVHNLQILYRTSPLPRHVVSYRADLAPQLVSRIKEILMEMDQSEEGRATLRDFEQTTKFDELPDEVMRSFFWLQKHIDAEFEPQ